jgi:glucosamine 6-phosphate synthetase-like amidotransferase/phosphosugar isomerase protein
MYLEIGLVILVIILIILLIFCIPILLQIWRILKDVRVTLETLNQSLPMILKNMEEITVNVNSSTAVINQNVQNFSNAANRFQLIISDIIDNIQCIAPIAMKLPIFQTFRNVTAVIKGIRVFVDVLLNKEKV